MNVSYGGLAAPGSVRPPFRWASRSCAGVFAWRGGPSRREVVFAMLLADLTVCTGRCVFLPLFLGFSFFGTSALHGCAVGSDEQCMRPLSDSSEGGTTGAEGVDCGKKDGTLFVFWSCVSSLKSRATVCQNAWERARRSPMDCHVSRFSLP